jgi:hypothetical protein
MSFWHAMGCDGFRSSQSPQWWIYWENATDEIQDYPYYYLVGGIPTPLKNDGVKVSWDDYSIPN